MKIFSAAQIRACDAYTIKAGGITSADLMERAAGKCMAWLRQRYDRSTLFVVLCGPGNNGGDGLAITRLLHQAGYGVKAFVLSMDKELTADCQANLQRLQLIDSELVGFIANDTFITDIPPHIIIIDAIFGTGMSRPVQGWVAAFLSHINQLPNTRIAIDMPSGLLADTIPDKGAIVLQAQDTLSFQFYKRTFLHPESAMHAGNIHLLDIGLDKAFIANTHTQYCTADAADIAAIYRPRNAWGHKGSYGNVFMAGGSYGKMGAVILSSKAALRAGAGLVTALIPECGYSIFQTALPEAMCLTSGERIIDSIGDWEHATAIGIGPGLGTDAATVRAFAAFVDACNKPMVADADALNIISRQPELLGSLPKGSIITPHPKEFARLFGENTNSMIQADHARIQAMRYGINIVLKGHHTMIITPEGSCHYNTTGNSGMATAGAGDVLTGIITGLLAQGYAPHHAAILGVYLHGAAGDIAAAAYSKEAIIAGDIIEHVGKAFAALASK